MLPAVEAMGGEIVECAVLVDRSGGGTQHLTSPATGPDLPAALALAARSPDVRAGRRDLPACADGAPLHTPGSSGTGA